jgi:hypothetical protein
VPDVARESAARLCTQPHSSHARAHQPIEKPAHLVAVRARKRGELARRAQALCRMTVTRKRAWRSVTPNFVTAETSSSRSTQQLLSQAAIAPPRPLPPLRPPFAR